MSYRMITEKMGFDRDAGQSIDGTMTLREMTDYVYNYINKGNKGCCFHASVYLMKLLHVLDIESELIITAEPTTLEDGSTRIDNRASLLVKDGDKYIVMNPIEDIEFFEKNSILPKERGKYYLGKTTILNGEKEGIHSKNAAEIELKDFIKRYGNGSAWTLGTLFNPENKNMTFNEFLKGAKLINLDEYTSSNQSSI